MQSQPGSLDPEDSVQEMSGYIEPEKMGEESLFEGEEEPYEVPDEMEVSEDGRWTMLTLEIQQLLRGSCMS